MARSIRLRGQRPRTIGCSDHVLPSGSLKRMLNATVPLPDEWLQRMGRNLLSLSEE